MRSVSENIIHLGLFTNSGLVAQMVKSLCALQKIRIRSMGWEDPLEKEMATHSSIAWEIPWTEELVVYSPWSCRVGQDWMTKQQKQQIVDLECCVSSRYTAKWFSYTYTCIYSFQIIFPFRLLQNIEQNSLCYTVDHCWLSILNIATCTCQFQTLSDYIKKLAIFCYNEHI